MSTKNSHRYVSRITRDTLAIILAGGQGSRLKELTAWRAKPSVPFGGKFRIIDLPFSNCVNAGIRRIAVATQYKTAFFLLLRAHDPASGGVSAFPDPGGTGASS